MEPAVYILTNKSRRVLYTGVTSNLARRIFEHQNKLIPGFTSRYNVDHLVYFERHIMMIEAIAREKLIKKKSRRGKVKLIESINPNWQDLSAKM